MAHGADHAQEDGARCGEAGSAAREAERKKKICATPQKRTGSILSSGQISRKQEIKVGTSLFTVYFNYLHSKTNRP